MHGENVQIELFRQLEMWSRIDRIDEILDEHSHLSDAFAKAELYLEGSAIDLIQQHEERPIGYTGTSWCQG